MPPTQPLRSKRWPSLRTQLEASPQELCSNAGHFPPALGMQYSVQPCHHLGGTVWLSHWPRSTPSPLPRSLRRRPAVVLCTLPGRCQAHIHQTAPGKRAQAQRDTPLNTRGFLTHHAQEHRTQPAVKRLGPPEPREDSAASPHLSSHSISDPGSNGETEAPGHKPDFIKLVA